MSFERRVYALKRMARLNDKLSSLTMLLAVRAHSDNPCDIEVRKRLMKQQRSTLTSIRRWEKELGQ
jgi:hypothetical protein